MSRIDPPRYFGGIQLLRGLAALAVFASHLALKGKLYWAGLIPSGGELGTYGVDLFFVISGFIIVTSTRKSPHSVRTSAAFLVGRWGRIYPAYWAALIVCLAVTALWPGSITSPITASLSDSVLLWPATSTPLLRSAWTLVHELYFYEVFALLLLFRPRWLPLALGLWTMATIALGVAGTKGLELNTGLALVANPLTLEFVLGATVALFVERRLIVAPAGAVVVGAVGLLGGALAMVATGSHIDPRFAGMTRVVLVGGPAALLVYGLSTLEANRRWTAPAIMNWLGDRSYTLYLVNLPVCAVLALMTAKGLGPGPLGLVIYVVAAIGAVAVLTEALHRVVERPSILLSKRWAKALDKNASRGRWRVRVDRVSGSTFIALRQPVP
jgi:exopolysaccharide production protein ExoZ